MNNKIWHISTSPEFDDDLFDRLAAEVLSLDADTVNAELAKSGLNTAENLARLSNWLNVGSGGGHRGRARGTPSCSKGAKKRSKTTAATIPQARKTAVITNTIAKHCAHAGFNTGVLQISGKRSSKDGASTPPKPGGFRGAETRIGMRPEPRVRPSSPSNLNMGMAMSLLSNASFPRPAKR